MPDSADVTGAAVQVRLDGPLFVALEDWRRAQPKIVPRSWALKQLLERALADCKRRGVWPYYPTAPRSAIISTPRVGS